MFGSGAACCVCSVPVSVSVPSCVVCWEESAFADVSDGVSEAVPDESSAVPSADWPSSDWAVSGWLVRSFSQTASAASDQTTRAVGL